MADHENIEALHWLVYSATTWATVGNAGCCVLRPLHVGGPPSVLWGAGGGENNTATRKEPLAGRRGERTETGSGRPRRGRADLAASSAHIPPQPRPRLSSTQVQGGSWGWSLTFAPPTECTRHLEISRIHSQRIPHRGGGSSRGLGLPGGTWKLSSPIKASHVRARTQRSASRQSTPPRWTQR